MDKSVNLYPTLDWLYKDHTDGRGREFLPSATVPADDEKNWHECTDADKSAYEEEQRKKAEVEQEDTQEDTQEDSELLPNDGVTDVDA